MSADHPDQTTRGAFRVRLHSLMGYHLGFLAGKLQSFAKRPTVAVVSDDTQLLPAMADAKTQGLDVRLVWPESALPDETKYFAGRNSVPTMLVHPEMMATTNAPSQLRYLETLLKMGR